MSKENETFFTTTGCMDGRAQRVVAEVDIILLSFSAIIGTMMLL